MEQKRHRSLQLPVSFKGRDDLFYFKDTRDNSGPLGTQEEFDNFETSFAYVTGGKILRYGVVIGTEEELIERKMK